MLQYSIKTFSFVRFGTLVERGSKSVDGRVKIPSRSGEDVGIGSEVGKFGDSDECAVNSGRDGAEIPV